MSNTPDRGPYTKGFGLNVSDNTNPTPKFKAGDRVRVLQTRGLGLIKAGELGTIERIATQYRVRNILIAPCYLLRFDTDTDPMSLDVAAWDSNLELVK